MFINESENPYEALSYLIGECNYGGRVTDDWDRRLIVTILEDFLSPQVANKPSYRFVNLPVAYYGLPKENSHNDYVNHINSMPQVHPPEAFGLHTNAGITKDLQNSNMLLNSVLKAYGEGSTGGGEDVDKYLMLLTSDILAKLPNVFDIETAKMNYPVVYNESMNTVLVQEMERFNKLLVVIRGSLVNLQKAIKGLVAMSPAVEAFSTSLMLSRIPSNWMGVSYPSLKNLPDYIADFLKRIDFLQKWFEEGKPKSYWVSGFFFTQAFLTGVKQNYARKYTIPIDKLTYDFEVMKDENFVSAPPDGAYIFGLFTDGARWNRNLRILDELQPKVLNEIMPTIWVKPVKLDDLKPKGRYTCPIYKTSTRRGVLSTTGHSTNYVLPILLETKQSCSHWIKRSVALLCQSD